MSSADLRDHILASVTATLLATDSFELLVTLLPHLKPFEQRKYLSSVLTFIVKQYFSSDHVSYEDAAFPASASISGTARLLYNLTKESDSLKDHLMSLLTRSVLPSLDVSLAARRSVMAALAREDGRKQSILCKYTSPEKSQKRCTRCSRTA
jgi:telomere length regulation protein